MSTVLMGLLLIGGSNVKFIVLVYTPHFCCQYLAQGQTADLEGVSRAVVDH